MFFHSSASGFFPMCSELSSVLPLHHPKLSVRTVSGETALSNFEREDFTPLNVFAMFHVPGTVPYSPYTGFYSSWSKAKLAYSITIGCIVFWYSFNRSIGCHCAHPLFCIDLQP